MFSDRFKQRNCSFIIIFLFIVGLSFCKKTPTAPLIEDTSRPIIWVNTYEISFSTSVSGGNPSPQTLQIKNSGPNTLEYNLEVDADWVSISPVSGISTGQVNEHTVAVDKTKIQGQKGTFEAKLLVKSAQAYNNPQEVRVTLQVSEEPPPQIWISTQKLTFNAQEGGENPSFQILQVRNDGDGTLQYTLNWDAAWLEVSPAGGTTKGALRTHKVFVDITGLSPGSYSGTITISDPAASNSPRRIQVSLNIHTSSPPSISVSPVFLSFSATAGGDDPSSETFRITNTGGGTLKYTATSDSPWLAVTPTRGQLASGDSKVHAVLVDIDGPEKISVTLEVGAPPTDNKISISCSPASGGTDTIVSVPVSILGNLNEIAVFGLDLTFDASIFSFITVEKGSLTGSWAAVDGNEVNPGTVKIGGFAGAGTTIPTGSSGTIAVVKLRVISTASGSRKTQLSIKNYIDHITGMIPASASVTFTYTN